MPHTGMADISSTHLFPFTSLLLLSRSHSLSLSLSTLRSNLRINTPGAYRGYRVATFITRVLKLCHLSVEYFVKAERERGSGTRTPPGHATTHTLPEASLRNCEYSCSMYNCLCYRPCSVASTVLQWPCEKPTNYFMPMASHSSIHSLATTNKIELVWHLGIQA